MKASDRAILAGVVVLGLIAAFWFLVLSPKRAEVSDLDGQITELRSSVATAEQTAATAEEAKADYASNYHSLVVLGKAVPAEEDTASLLVEVQKLAADAGIFFDSIKLSSGGEAPTPPPAAETTADQASPSDGAAEPSAETLTAAPATEAAAATLPLGATVGPAGLPVMPYDLHFRGGFFEVADFIQSLDSLVDTGSDGVGVDGRLLTVDGFSFGPDQAAGFPHLVADLHVTTYVAPADQGLVGGASPTLPPEAVSPEAPTTTSNTTVTP